MFLRICDTAINTEYIRTIHFSPEERQVIITFFSLGSPERLMRFRDEGFDRFMDWWDRKAELYHA
jgi:hypothetical protein